MHLIEHVQCCTLLIAILKINKIQLNEMYSFIIRYIYILHFTLLLFHIVNQIYNIYASLCMNVLIRSFIYLFVSFKVVVSYELLR